MHETTYQYSDQTGKRRAAQARVLCPLGLSASDELYLWGLLALTLSMSELSPDLRATPHWCLRQLGIINQHNRRGGRQYEHFASAIRRLAAVRYLNDAFYDPVRAEHRRVTFGFFSVSLPHDPASSRAWRFMWDPLFFEMVSAAAGQFRFDFELYRSLDPATRRLLLFARKVFARRQTLPTVQLQHIAVSLLGFSPSLATRDMKAKVKRCTERLRDIDILSTADFIKDRQGRILVRLSRGPLAVSSPSIRPALAFEEHPLWNSLLDIGFDPPAAQRLLRQYPTQLLAEWIDITQAAIERFGHGYFSRSPMAFFVDSVSKAAKGTRTAPDWWHTLRRTEDHASQLPDDSRQVFANLQSALFGTSRSQDATEETPQSQHPQRARDILRAL